MICNTCRAEPCASFFFTRCLLKYGHYFATFFGWPSKHAPHGCTGTICRCVTFSSRSRAIKVGFGLPRIGFAIALLISVRDRFMCPPVHPSLLSCLLHIFHLCYLLIGRHFTSPWLLLVWFSGAGRYPFGNTPTEPKTRSWGEYGHLNSLEEPRYELCQP